MFNLNKFSVIIIMAFFCLDIFGQGTVTLGTGTSYNGNTQYPTPYGTYNKNMRVQYLVLKSELNALGVSAGNITALGFNVYALNTIKYMPGYSIKMKSTSASTKGTTFENEGFKEVWYSASFKPVVGWNTHTFYAPFYWDNNSNILIDICFEMLSENASANAQVYYTSQPSYMVTHYNSNNFTACGTYTSASRYYNRANMQITWATTTCPPPLSLTAQNMTISTAQLGWTERGSATQWNVEVGLPDFTPGTGTYVKNVTGTTSNPWTVTGLDSLKLYEFYVRANCGGTLSQWEGPYEFQTGGSPLSGIYTIDKTQPTLGKNFNSFTDMAKALNSSVIEGPVTINVVAGSGPYTEQVILKEFSGSSATNTVTINGNNDSLQYYSTNHLELATLKIKGSDYLTVHNLTIKALATGTYEYGYAVHLMNGADYNTFSNCIFKANTSSNSTSYAAFVASNAISAPETAGLAASYLTISNCKTEGGYYGIVIQGPTSPPFAVSNVFTNNEITDFFSYGLYLRGQNNALISENEFHRPTRTSGSTLYALYTQSDMSACKVEKNQIYNFSTVPLTVWTVPIGFTGLTTSTGEALEISNNIVYGLQNMNGPQEGIYITSSATPCNVNIYHNTIALDNTSQTGSSAINGIYFSSTANATIDIRNNIFTCSSTSTGTKSMLYFTGSGTKTLTSDNNVFYFNTNTGTNRIAYWNPTTLATLADWQAYNSNAYDQNSYDVNPQFTSPLLTPRRFAFDNSGANLSAIVTEDFFGVTRPATPDPGAIEYEGIACVSPISLTVSNILDDAASLGWTEIGDASQWNVEVGLTGFTPGNGEAVTSGTAITDNPWTASGLNYYTDYEFYMQSDCGSGNLSTWEGPFAFKTLSQLMSGTYTINSTEPTAGTNFNSFTDLATRLNNGGFEGPVTVNVVQSTGPYNESFILNNLSFSSAVNTLTINGNNETLQFLSTDNYQRATFKLNGTDYVTVNDLVIEALGTNSNEYGFAAHIKGSANNNTFNNCRFISNMSSDLSNYAAFVMNDNDTSCTAWSRTAVANNLTVSNCTTTGGYYGMAICGAAISYTPAESITISNNDIKDFYFRGLTVIGASNSLIEGNTISRPERTNDANIEMMHLASYQNGTIISKNIITGFSSVANSNSVNGITSNQLIAETGGGMLFKNNLIYGYQNTNGALGGISLNTYSTTNTFKFYHNTVSIDNTTYGGSSGVTCFGYNGSYDNIELKNNIFSFTTNTSGSKYCYLFSSSTGLTVTSNNNVLHMGYSVGTTRCAYKSPTSYNTLANWQAAGFDINSSDSDPAFVAPLRTPTNAAVANIGANLLSVVPDDINGASRTTTPDPGVLEFVPQTCLQPTAIVLSNYSASTAVLNWTEQGSATLWNTEVGAAGFTPGTGASLVSQTGVSSKPWTASGLSANTAYDFYVRSDCGGGDLSSWAGPYQFRTLCSNTTSFNENFDGVTQPSLPDCWRKAGEVGTIYSYSNQSYSPPNGLAISSINSTVIMPPVSNAGDGTHMLRLWGRVFVNPQTARLQVGYLTNPTDPATFVMIDSLKFTTTSYFEHDIYLGTAPGANNLLALKAMSTHGFYLDDIRWVPICPVPTAQTLTALNATTANFSWTESGSATLWDVEVGVMGFLPGTGTAVTSGTDITSTAWQATGLNPNTAYDFYVRSDCGSNYSSWVGPVTFTTPCSPANLPLTESVDDASFPDCWQTTVSGIWSANNSNNAGGSPYEFRALFKSYTGISRLVAPLINTSGLSIINLKFLTSLTPNTAGAVLKIQSSSDGVNWTDEGWSKNSNQLVLGGTEVDINITNNLGANTYIAWVIDGNHMAFNNWRVDNVRITGCSPCTNLSAGNKTNSSADLTWNAGDSETLWNIEWGTAGFTFGSGTRITGHNSTTYNLNGLSPNTTYDFYVQADCVSDTSAWAGPYTFTTECNPISSLPWTEGFESVTTPEFPECWTFGNGGWATQTNGFSTKDADARTGTQFLTDNWYATDEFIWTPGFQLTGGTAYDFSFWWAGDNYPGWTGEVYYNTTHNSTGATALGAAFIETGTTTDKIYRNVLRTFTPLVSGVYYFALKINTAHPDAWYISFDDFLLEVAPPCGTPTDVSASNITSTTADLSWTAGSNQILWDIEVGASGFTPETGMSLFSATGVSSTSWQAAGLTPNTAYDFYVRAQCNGGGYSYWSEALNFTTTCGLFGLPYEDGFENNICWTQVDIDGGGSYWGITTSTNHTPGGTTSAYHNYGASGYAETGMLYSPQIVFPSDVTIELTFWSYNALPLSYGKNSLLISTDGTNYTEIWSPVSVTEAWAQTTLDLTAYAGNTIKLAFKYEGTYAHRWYIDDIKITQNLYVDETNQIITSNATYENVTVEPSGELTLNAGNVLTINGDFTIESDETGTGSFIQNGTLNVTGDITVQKYLPNTTLTGWTLSIPVVSADADIFTDALGLYRYNASTTGWELITSGALEQMTGYVSRFPLTKTIEFDGTLNNNTFVRNDLIRTTTPNNFGWNHVGNPYPSPIDWEANPGISRTHINNAIYFRRADGNVSSFVDGEGNNGGTRYIPSMQAFWVQVTQGQTNGSLQITNDARVHASNNFYKTTTKNVLRLLLSFNGLNDEAVIRFNSPATANFDGEYDAFKMFADNDAIPQIYTFAGTELLSINSLPEPVQPATVAAGFKTQSAGMHNIAADVTTFENDFNIFLEDKTENILIDLKQNNNYSFYASATDEDRFLLHFHRQSSGSSTAALDNFSVYAFDNVLYISGLNNNTTTLSIYNLLGQELLHKQINNENLCKITTELNSGIYLVKVVSNNISSTYNVFLK